MTKSTNYIRIVGSSFLLPGNQCWSKFSKFGKYLFGEYGNFTNHIVKSKKNETLILVLSISDLISKINFSNSNTNLIFQGLVSQLRKRLNNSQKLTILALETFLDFSVVSMSKYRPKINLEISKLKKVFYQLSLKYSNFFIVDLDYEFSKHGFYNCLDQRNWYFAHCRYSLQGLNLISNSLKDILHRYYNTASKVLVLDCDNTLWGGVVGEEGLSGISLGEDGIGQAYSDFQTSIKRLSNEGVIIALSSKNNEQDVWNVFNKNTNMVLKKKDIINAKINWEEKFINIKKISKELSLGLNSFVFWDDNPIERQKVMINCPDVDVIDVPKNVYEWPNYLNRLYNFSKFYITEEDYKKKDQYKARSKFVSDQNKNRSNLNFLKKIKIRPKLLKLNKSNIKRASQLTMKTNQFNFRTKRYSETDIINTEKNKKKIIYLLHLKDIYADYGNIGMVIIELMDNNTAFLDTFLMSCRILGRNVEKWFISEIVKFCKNKKIKNIYIELIISCRNQVAKNFLNDSIFSEIKSFDFNGKLIKNKINKKKIFKIDVSKFSFNNKKMYE